MSYEFPFGFQIDYHSEKGTSDVNLVQIHFRSVYMMNLFLALTNTYMICSVIQEIGLKALEHSRILMPVLLTLLKDENPLVAKQSIITVTNFFCSTLEELALQVCLYHWTGMLDKESLFNSSRQICSCHFDCQSMIVFHFLVFVCSSWHAYCLFHKSLLGHILAVQGLHEGYAFPNLVISSLCVTFKLPKVYMSWSLMMYQMLFCPF